MSPVVAILVLVSLALLLPLLAFRYFRRLRTLQQRAIEERHERLYRDALRLERENHDALCAALHRAVAYLRERGDNKFFSGEPEISTTFELARIIEQSAERLAKGNEEDLKRLWVIFAVASTWDDAGGDSQLGQEVFDQIDAVHRPRGAKDSSAVG